MYLTVIIFSGFQPTISVLHWLSSRTANKNTVKFTGRWVDELLFQTDELEI